MLKKEFSNRTVIITSDEPWSDVWHTQINYAWQLSRRYNVIFLGPPRKWSPLSLLDFRQKKRKINDSLIVVDYVNPLPLSLGKWALFVDDKINQFLVWLALPPNPLKEKLILWRFDSIRSLYIFKSKKGARQIYHVIDPKFGSNVDPELTANAELVIVTSPRVVGSYQAVHNNVINLKQGVDLSFYSEPTTDDLTSTKDSVGSIMLLGSFTNDVDYLLLAEIANTFFDINLMMIGPDRINEETKKIQFNALLSKKNVFYLGSMPPKDFRHHLNVCSVGIIAYDNLRKEANKLRSPLKAMSYLAADKCIISNIDCEIPSMVGKGIYLTENKNEFLRLIQEAISGRLLFDQDAKKALFMKHDYQILISKVFDLLSEKLDEPKW